MLLDINKIDGVVVVAIAFAPVVGLLLVRKRLGVLNAAAWLTIWGALVLSGEHGGWALILSVSPAVRAGVGAHARFHFFMAGAYAFVAAVLLGVVAWTLLRSGYRIGWYAVLFTLIFGGAFEVVAGASILTHGFSPHSIPLGLFLYSYIAALGSALVISYWPIFRKVNRSGT